MTDMELKEILAKICEIRFELEELADECNELWRESNGETADTASFLGDELGILASNLSELEDTEI